MAPPFILTLLLETKVEHQEEDTPSNGLPFPVNLACRRPGLTEIPGMGWFRGSLTFTDCTRAA